ncbi:hypothetical protein [Methylobacterium sp. WSM2598]|uniref:hypothetical protein n=1 Tax=Methylobacterium sp. WSM2598 TaxID=398261 RepID=UPI00036D0651|nr:hypothetical protein [Methylobacterium sp. WSM2598]
MDKTLYRVTEVAPAHLLGRRVEPGELISASPAAVPYEVDLGHLVATTVEAEAQPIAGLSEAERAALPPLDPVAADETPAPARLRAEPAAFSFRAGADQGPAPAAPSAEG